MSRKLRFGVLSTANIGRNQVNPAIRASRNAELVAVASRDLVRAREFAVQGGIGRHYGSYEALLDDPGIDAVYRLMVEHFADVAQGNATLRYGMEYSIGNLKAIEALYHSARSGGRPVAVRDEGP